MFQLRGHRRDGGGLGGCFYSKRTEGVPDRSKAKVLLDLLNSGISLTVRSRNLKKHLTERALLSCWCSSVFTEWLSAVFWGAL